MPFKEHILNYSLAAAASNIYKKKLVDSPARFWLYFQAHKMIVLTPRAEIGGGGWVSRPPPKFCTFSPIFVKISNIFGFMGAANLIFFALRAKFGMLRGLFIFKIFSPPLKEYSTLYFRTRKGGVSKF